MLLKQYHPNRSTLRSKNPQTPLEGAHANSCMDVLVNATTTFAIGSSPQQKSCMKSWSVLIFSPPPPSLPSSISPRVQPDHPTAQDLLSPPHLPPLLPHTPPHWHQRGRHPHPPPPSPLTPLPSSHPLTPPTRPRGLCALPPADAPQRNLAHTQRGKRVRRFQNTVCGPRHP